MENEKEIETPAADQGPVEQAPAVEAVAVIEEKPIEQLEIPAVVEEKKADAV